MEYEQGEKPNERNYFNEGADWQSHYKYIAFEVIILKKLGYIEYDERRAFITGGPVDDIYHHNVLMIYWDTIKLKPLGIEYVQGIRKTLL